MEILVVDDEAMIRESAVQLIEDAGHYAEGASDSETALHALGSASFDLVLLDLNLGKESGVDLLKLLRKSHARTSVVMFSGAASISSVAEATRLGALDFLEKPFTRDQLAVALQRVSRVRQLEAKVEDLRQLTATKELDATNESAAPSMHAALDILMRAADSMASILLLGESGTGKSSVARDVHARSGRSAAPLVTINCPALSRELLESELFGHVKGAFTGAVKDTRGKVHAAAGGTLFLDEIGELPLEIQPKLLRLLQDGEYERVGETRTFRADVRVIAATNRDLAQEVREGRFREDLFFRLNVITVTLPPLRERREDIAEFAGKYLQFFAEQYSRPVNRFSEDALALLESATWPGNLREMRNAVERAVILSRGGKIEPQDLPGLRSDDPEGDVASLPQVGGNWTLEALTNAHIRAVVASASTYAKAAEILGIDEATLYRRRKKLVDGAKDSV